MKMYDFILLYNSIFILGLLAPEMIVGAVLIRRKQLIGKIPVRVDVQFARHHLAHIKPKDFTRVLANRPVDGKLSEEDVADGVLALWAGSVLARPARRMLPLLNRHLLRCGRKAYASSTVLAWKLARRRTQLPRQVLTHVPTPIAGDNSENVVVGVNTPRAKLFLPKAAQILAQAVATKLPDGRIKAEKRWRSRGELWPIMFSSYCTFQPVAVAARAGEDIVKEAAAA